MEKQTEVSRQVQESLASTTLIKVFASEGRVVEQVTGALKGILDLSLEQIAVNWLAGQVMNLVLSLARSVIFLVEAISVIQGHLQLGQLLAIQSYLGFVSGPVLSLAIFTLHIQNSLIALERVAALFEILPEENLGEREPVGRLNGEVAFKGISFSYNGSELVPEKISVRIVPGEQTLIVEPSRVRRTTLMRLILRFYRPTRCEVCFDDRPACEHKLGSLYKQIRYVSQSPLLIAGTILDSLCYGGPKALLEKVMQATKATGIHDFIIGLSEGYDSLVRERGVNLSEGQKQRLSLARALVKESDNLVLYEPIASIDSLIERTIFEALPELTRDKTVFLVAHRLATVQYADLILLLNEKSLVDIGIQTELTEQSEYNCTLVESQHLEGALI
jgi:ABC-type multidrug transport system fused ATPase/permease subunit